jgi:hypothetical protein
MADVDIRQSKACTKCGKVKSLTDFSVKKTAKDGRVAHCRRCGVDRSMAWHNANKERAHARSRAWRADNPARVKDYNRQQYADNKDHHRERFAKWVAANPARRRDYMRGWYDENPGKHKQYNDARATPQHRLENAIRCRIWCGIVGGSKKERRTFDLLGYTSQELRAHLERQFNGRMSWDNYGVFWHVDHIVPLALFRYETPEDPEFRAAWALPNLRPLWKIENIKKGAKRLTLL